MGYKGTPGRGVEPGDKRFAREFVDRETHLVEEGNRPTSEGTARGKNWVEVDTVMTDSGMEQPEAEH